MRLIDADELLEKTECLFKDLNSTEDFMGIGYNHGVGDSIAIIKNAPTIEAEPVKHGRWIFSPDHAEGICTRCNYKIYGRPYQNTYMIVPYNHCPNCGARMEVEE